MPRSTCNVQQPGEGDRSVVGALAASVEVGRRTGAAAGGRSDRQPVIPGLRVRFCCSPALASPAGSVGSCFRYCRVMKGGSTGGLRGRCFYPRSRGCCRAGPAAWPPPGAGGAEFGGEVPATTEGYRPVVVSPLLGGCVCPACWPAVQRVLPRGRAATVRQVVPRPRWAQCAVCGTDPVC